jgi:hypothetical protein
MLDITSTYHTEVGKIYEVDASNLEILLGSKVIEDLILLSLVEHKYAKPGWYELCSISPKLYIILHKSEQGRQYWYLKTETLRIKQVDSPTGTREPPKT